jgi:flagellar basal-body rod protein FlgC
MNLLDTLSISATGLSAQRTRMNVIASNMANVNTTRTPDGLPYRRQEVVFAAQSGSRSFKDVLNQRLKGSPGGVQVMDVVADQRPFRMKYDPGHPDADDRGYVAMPNVNPVEEMVNMLSATRSYEAGISVIKATKNMALKALEIGK